MQVAEFLTFSAEDAHFVYWVYEYEPLMRSCETVSSSS
jgi:hypothetical protein